MKIVLPAIIALAIVLTFIKGCTNNAAHLANPDGGLPSPTISKSSSDGLLVAKYNIEAVNVTTPDVHVKPDEVWLERMAQDEYVLWWVHRRVPLSGQQIVISSSSKKVMFWLDGASRSFARSGDLFYSGSVGSLEDTIRINVVRDGSKEPSGYILLKRADKKP